MIYSITPPTHVDKSCFCKQSTFIMEAIGKTGVGNTVQTLLDIVTWEYSK